MKWARVLVLLFLISLAGESLAQVSMAGFPQRKRRRSPIDSKVFLANWWDYYNRATRRIDSGDLKGAEADLRAALKFRTEDSAHARAYGVRFQEYYPHYELGIILFDSGRHDEALRELKASLAAAPLEETRFFIHEARRRIALRDRSDRSHPTLEILEPVAGIITSKTSILVKGIARDDIYVDEITVNSRPLLVDRAKSEVRFEVEVPLPRKMNRIPVVVTDLVGKTTTADILVEVDREGPVFSLRRIRLSSDGRSARLTGAAFDPHQLTRITLNKTPLSLPPSITSLTIDQEFPLQVANGTLHLELEDGFGNKTVAELDPKMKVGSTPSVSREIQVASLNLRPGYFFAPSSVPQSEPEIEVDGYRPHQKVFLKEIYVDGWVADSTDIRQIKCNGEDLFIPPGNYLYFGYTWGPLKAGTHTLQIEAVNAMNRRGEFSLPVECHLPADVTPEQRLSIVTGDFDVIGKVSPLDPTKRFGRELQGQLTRRDRFHVLPTDDALKKILREMEIARSSATDQSSRAPDGTLRAGDLLVEGQFLEYEGVYTLDISIVSIQQNRTLLQTSMVCPDKSPVAFRKLARGLAIKLEQMFPSVQGNILSLSPTVSCDLSKDLGMEAGMQVIAFRTIPSATGTSNERKGGDPFYEIGPLTVTHVWKDTSTLHPESTMKEAPLVGDIVVTR